MLLKVSEQTKPSPVLPGHLRAEQYEWWPGRHLPGANPAILAQLEESHHQLLSPCATLTYMLSPAPYSGCALRTADWNPFT